MKNRPKKSMGLKSDYRFARAKKALGQNFLKSEPALRRIVEAGEISEDDIILEIGPGKGALTKKLLEKSNHVVAIEKDKNLVEFLREKFEKEISENKLILIEGDILEFDIISFASSDFSSLRPSHDYVGGTLGKLKIERSSTLENSRGENENILRNFNYKIIANIPYNITGAILKKFLGGDLSTPLKARNQPSMMVLLVQLEVAKRIIARDGKESILSISVKAYGNPEMIMKVPARYFSPAPKVDSAVIAIKNISRNFFKENKVHEERFWQVIHAGFVHKRKKLASNLKSSGILISPEHIKRFGNKRAEDLSLSDWLLLTK